MTFKMYGSLLVDHVQEAKSAVARNRRDIDPGHKREEIIVAARRLFLADGYEASSMARIAAEAGIAPNTLYWYFHDKDELLIAILDALVTEGLADYESVATLPLDRQLLWLLGCFAAAPTLVSTVHARLAVSPAIDAWHAQFHRMLEALVVNLLAQRGVPEAERAPAARIALFVIEGLLSHHAGDPSEHATIAALLSARIAPIN